jgi:hypothetical protein
MHDVEDGISLDVTMPALVEIEDDASVATLFQKVLHLGVRGLEILVQIFDPQMKLRARLAGRCLHWRDVGLQDLNRVAAGVVEHQQAFDFDCSKPLGDALCVYRLDRPFQFLNENQRRSGRTASVSTTASKPIDNRKSKAFLPRQLAADG